MNDRFSPRVAAQLPNGATRQEAAAEAERLSAPTVETEEWRYSPIGELDLDELAPVAAAPSPESVAGFDVESAVADVVGERAATVLVLDGWVADIQLSSGWAEKGLEIWADGSVDPLDLEAERTSFDLLHRAFAPDALHIRVPTGLSVGAPVMIVNHHFSPDHASFSHVVVEAGEGSDVVVLERQTSADGTGLSVPLVQLHAGPAARLRYQSLQETGTEHWQLGRLSTRAAGQSTLTCGIAAFGAKYARLRTDGRLTGRGASVNMAAAYYGDREQIHDFRVFQHHDAPDTRSDLLFKGAQDDESGSIYTGLIHIHPDGAGSNAFQTNRNVKLSPDAWAWSVPNLEIENNDVHCSHASTVSPVDGDQQFYLQSRGVPPVTGDRLIVAGFFDEAISRLPVDSADAEVRRQIAEKLDRRIAREQA